MFARTLTDPSAPAAAPAPTPAATAVPDGRPSRVPGRLVATCLALLIATLWLPTGIAGASPAPPWRLSVVPGRGGTIGSGWLDSVSCVSPSACVAVSLGFQAVWNGTTWREVTNPDLDPYRVSCASATFCLATRYIEGPTRPLRWNGTTWSAAPAAAGVTTQYDIDCSSPTACLLLGTGPSGPRQRRWDGVAWRTADVTPPAELVSVSCARATACVATGRRGTGAAAARWDGSGWRPLRAPAAGELRDVSCPSATWCLATARASGQPDRIVRWTGAGWPAVPGGAAALAGRRVRSLSCGVPGRCLVLASDTGGVRTSAWLLDGDTWTEQRLPLTAGRHEQFVSVSCVGRSFCMAVGTRPQATDPFVSEPLAARWTAPATASATAAH